VYIHTDSFDRLNFPFIQSVDNSVGFLGWWIASSGNLC